MVNSVTWRTVPCPDWGQETQRCWPIITMWGPASDGASKLR